MIGLYNLVSAISAFFITCGARERKNAPAPIMFSTKKNFYGY